jgi:hypothetical protein
MDCSRGDPSTVSCDLIVIALVGEFLEGLIIDIPDTSRGCAIWGLKWGTVSYDGDRFELSVECLVDHVQGMLIHDQNLFHWPCVLELFLKTSVFVADLVAVGCDRDVPQ